MKSRVFLWIPLVWILCALAADFSFARPAVKIWPHAGRKLLAYTNMPPGGLASSRFDSSQSNLVLAMHLDTGVTWPVAGTIIFLDSNGIDLSGSGNLELKIAGTDLSSLSLCLVEDIPGFTKASLWYTAQYDCIDQELVPGTPTYKIPLNDFVTPSWWYRDAKILPSTLGPGQRRRVLRLVLQTGPGTPLGTDLELRISQLAIVPSNLALRAGIWGAALFLTALTLLLGWNRKRPTAIKPPAGSEPFFQPIEATSYADRERDAVVQCIGRDYSDPELSLEKISRTTGVPVDRVTSHVKMASGQLFKAYLNKVRGEAARKLLHETDLPIAEISQRVGYSNTPHFNRVFKELFDTTPTALREGPQADPSPDHAGS